jgi:UDP-N-acetyl-D-mannosaminuronic acid transferase (WecB/TagA/CpsF family)
LGAGSLLGLESLRGARYLTQAQCISTQGAEVYRVSLEGLKARLETVCGTSDVSEKLMAMAEEAEGKMQERTEKVREMLLGKVLPDRKIPSQQMP